MIRRVRAEFADEAAFRIKQALVRDVARNGMPKKPRADLHERPAGWPDRAVGPRNRSAPLARQSVDSARMLWMAAEPCPNPGKQACPRRACLSARHGEMREPSLLCVGRIVAVIVGEVVFEVMRHGEQVFGGLLEEA